MQQAEKAQIEHNNVSYQSLEIVIAPVSSSCESILAQSIWTGIYGIKK